MLYMKNLVLAETEKLPDNAGWVHPYYRESFKQLYEIRKHIPNLSTEKPPRENFNMLSSIICNVADSYDGNIVQFLDVRTTEEYCQVAPEYELLERAKLNSVNPMGLKGMGGLALPMAIKISDSSLRNGEASLICCADLPIPLDNRYERNACAFIVEKTDRIIDAIKICSYSDRMTEKELAYYIEQHCFDEIFRDTDELFINPFFSIRILEEKQELFNILIVWKREDFLGYLHLQRG